MHVSSHNHIRHTLNGFTLIEVLVALSIFTVVVTISIGALLAIIDANTRAQNIQSVITNVSFSLDSMSREIRTGTNYYCSLSVDLPVSGKSTSDCADVGSDAFAFREGGDSLTKNASSPWVAFRLHNHAIERRLGNGDGNSNPNEDSDWSAITTPDVYIDTLQFYVTGSARSDDKTPTVTIYISGYAGDEAATQGSFRVETTVSQLLLDV